MSRYTRLFYEKLAFFNSLLLIFNAINKEYKEAIF